MAEERDPLSLDEPPFPDDIVESPKCEPVEDPEP